MWTSSFLAPKKKKMRSVLNINTTPFLSTERSQLKLTIMGSKSLNLNCIEISQRTPIPWPWISLLLLFTQSLLLLLLLVHYLCSQNTSTSSSSTLLILSEHLVRQRELKEELERRILLFLSLVCNSTNCFWQHLLLELHSHTSPLWFY